MISYKTKQKAKYEQLQINIHTYSNDSTVKLWNIYTE